MKLFWGQSLNRGNSGGVALEYVIVSTFAALAAAGATAAISKLMQEHLSNLKSETHSDSEDPFALEEDPDASR